MKHGLTGSGAVQPWDEREAIRERLDRYRADLRPRDEVEEHLARRLALAAARMDRCARQEQAALDERLDKADRAFRDRRRKEISEVADQLRARPAATVARLRSSAAGCACLIATWELLRTRLEAGPWDEDHRIAALNLLGRSTPPTADVDDDRAALVWLGVLAQDPGDLDAVDRYFGTSTRGLAEAARRARATAELPSAEEGRASIRAVIAVELAELEALKDELYEATEALPRARALDRALFDDSDAARLRLRYESAAAAEYHKALNGLRKHRQQAEPPAAEVAAPVPNEANSPAEPVAAAVAAASAGAAEAPAPNEANSDASGWEAEISADDGGSVSGDPIERRGWGPPSLGLVGG